MPDFRSALVRSQHTEHCQPRPPPQLMTRLHSAQVMLLQSDAGQGAEVSHQCPTRAGSMPSAVCYSGTSSCVFALGIVSVLSKLSPGHLKEQQSTQMSRSCKL